MPEIEEHKTVLSFSRLLKIVISFELIVPIIAFLISVGVDIYTFVTKEEEEEVEIEAMKVVKEILTLSCCYVLMVVKMGMSILLWTAKLQRNLYKLYIWVIASIVLSLSGICLIFIAWVEAVTHVGLVVVLLALQMTFSMFAISVVVVFIRKLQCGDFWDYDECIMLRFEPREQYFATKRSTVPNPDTTSELN